MFPASEKVAIMEYRRPYLNLRRTYLAQTREWRRYHVLMEAYKKKVARGRPAIPPQTPIPTPSPPPIVESPDFNGMDPPAATPVTHHFFNTPWPAGKDVRIRQFIGNNEVAFQNQTVYPSSTQTISVTYVAVATLFHESLFIVDTPASSSSRICWNVGTGWRGFGHSWVDRCPWCSTEPISRRASSSPISSNVIIPLACPLCCIWCGMERRRRVFSPSISFGTLAFATHGRHTTLSSTWMPGQIARCIRLWCQSQRPY